MYVLVDCFFVDFARELIFGAYWKCSRCSLYRCSGVYVGAQLRKQEGGKLRIEC